MGARPCPRKLWTPEWKDGDGRVLDTPPDDGTVVEVRNVEVRSVEVVAALTITAREMEERFDVGEVAVVLKDFEDVRWRYRELMRSLREQRTSVRTMYKWRDQ